MVRNYCLIIKNIIAQILIIISLQGCVINPEVGLMLKALGKCSHYETGSEDHDWCLSQIFDRYY